MRLSTTASRRGGVGSSKDSDDEGSGDNDEFHSVEVEIGEGLRNVSSSLRPASRRTTTAAKRGVVRRSRARRHTFAQIINRRLAMMGVIIFIISWIVGFVSTYIWVSYYSDNSSIGTTKNSRNQNLIVNRNPNPKFDSPLLIFTCKRENYLKETLETILKYIPHNCQFGCPVIVSEDGKHDTIKSVIDTIRPQFDNIGIPLIHMVHTQNLRRGVSSATSAYVALAQHYKWALTNMFGKGKYGSSVVDDDHYSDLFSSNANNNNNNAHHPDRVIILEEDIRIAPDFFEYMKATAPILDEDPTLLAVSAFNDNGHQGISDPTRLLRSDFFPGLGWMMTASLWDEMKVKWPDGYWDDWLRDPLQRKDRQVIRPEISRTYHFGKKGGASSNQFGSILERVQLDTEVVDWASQDLSYLLPARYEQSYMEMVRHSRRSSSLQEGLDVVSGGESDAVVSYAGFADFQDLARQLGLMDDEKAGIPRTAYKGIVETRPYSKKGNDHFLFLAPIDVM